MSAEEFIGLVAAIFAAMICLLLGVLVIGALTGGATW